LTKRTNGSPESHERNWGKSIDKPLPASQTGVTETKGRKRGEEGLIGSEDERKARGGNPERTLEVILKEGM